ncbi:MdtA/MuxA family multidrug efflux RND transporter periplasmic adaptor subunit [Cognatishimia sp. WU-CL00825]|uniref:efflux RND transporter periplasmic adaptor subunit n=1 Tax=Cognatishimia sp. WU-CL00825 TaxID=3127658 RepID=UPI00310568F5
MRFLRQSMIGLFLIAVTAGLLVVAMGLVSGAVEERVNKEPRIPQKRERIFTVNVVAATPTEITPEIAVFGEVQSQRTLDLRSSTGGVLRYISDDFREGGQVRAGDLLAQIDTSDAEDALARAETELQSALDEKRETEQALVLAQDEKTSADDQVGLRERALVRQKDLAERGVGTAASVETAELNLSTAQQQVLSRRQSLAQAEASIGQADTRVARANIALAEAKRDLDDLQIIAEFDGTLAEVSAVQGGLVSANERLAQLIDPSALEVAFRVSTAQYARLLTAQGNLRPAEVKVALNATGVALLADGVISRDSAAVGEGQTGRLVFATLTKAPGLKPGDFVSVAVREQPLRGVVRLPSAALDPQGRVLVVGDQDRLEAISVDLLRRQGDQVLLRAGDLNGRLAVTQLTPLLGAGIRVKPVLDGADKDKTNLTATEPAEPTPDLLELSEERRAKLMAFVQNNQRMPAERKETILNQLSQPKVPAGVVQRLEQRMGG